MQISFNVSWARKSPGIVLDMYYQPNGLNTMNLKPRKVCNILGISHQFIYLCNNNNSDQNISIIYAVKMSLTKVMVSSMQ